MGKIDDLPACVCHYVDVARNAIRQGVIEAGFLAKKAYPCDLVLRLFRETMTVASADSQGPYATSAGAKTIDATRDFYGAVRIISSLDYFFNGGFSKDLKESKVASMISEAAFFVGRGLETMHYAAKQKLIDLEAFAQKAKNVGGTYAFQAANFVRAANLMNAAYFVGLVGFVYQEGRGIQSGEKVFSHAMNATSYTIDTIVVGLIIYGYANMAVLSAFGAVAAATAIAGWLSDPENREQAHAQAKAQAVTVNTAGVAHG